MPGPPSIPGTGFVGLGDYLSANRDPLASGFTSLQKEAAGDVAGAQGPAGQAQQDAAMKAQSLGVQLGSESGLAGRYGGSGGGFDASLMWGQYGPQMQSLSQYLGQQQVKQPDAPPPAPGAPPPPPPGGVLGATINDRGYPHPRPPPGANPYNIHSL